MIKIPQSVNKDISRQAHKLLKKSLFSVAMQTFLQIKNDMIEEFLNHPVTVEIKAGPESANTSGLLYGKGNLFSFIGFEEGEDPTGKILEMLESSTIIDTNQFDDQGRSFQIKMPTAQDIFDPQKTPMPWNDGRSWAKGIESGISGLNFYLYKKAEKSRSGMAWQTDEISKLRSGYKFKNTKYISALINKYNNIFNKIR